MVVTLSPFLSTTPFLFLIHIHTQTHSLPLSFSHTHTRQSEFKIVNIVVKKTKTRSTKTVLCKYTCSYVPLSLSLLTSPCRSKAPAMREGTLLSGIMNLSFTLTCGSEEKCVRCGVMWCDVRGGRSAIWCWWCHWVYLKMGRMGRGEEGIQVYPSIPIRKCFTTFAIEDKGNSDHRYIRCVYRVKWNVDINRITIGFNGQ